MSKLTHEQKRLLFDYCFELTTESDTAQVKSLLASHSEAAYLCAKIKAALTPLDSLHSTRCPDYLVEKTVAICANHNNLERNAV